MTHPTRAFSGSIINRFTGSKILARVGQISVAFPTPKGWILQSYQLLILARCVFVRQTAFLPTKNLASVRGNDYSKVVITNQIEDETERRTMG